MYATAGATMDAGTIGGLGTLAILATTHFVVFFIGIFTGVLMLASYIGRQHQRTIERAMGEYDKTRPGDEWKQGEREQKKKDNDWLRRMLGE